MVEKLCELLSRLSGSGEDSTSITSSSSSTAFSIGWVLLSKLLRIPSTALIRSSVEVVGSPRRFDGNAATWDPCEPLMNVFREKVILTKREMQKIILLPLPKLIAYLFALSMVLYMIKQLFLG